MKVICIKECKNHYGDHLFIIGKRYIVHDIKDDKYLLQNELMETDKYIYYDKIYFKKCFRNEKIKSLLYE